MTTCRRRATSRVALAVASGALVACAFSAPAHAQLGRKSWEFFPHVGVLVPQDPGFLLDEIEEIDPGVLWGLYATYHYTDNVGVEMGFSKGTINGPEDESAVLGDVGLDFWELNGFVNNGALKPLQVFATAGGGLVNYDPEGGDGPTRLLLDGGVGIRWYKWKNIAIRAEVKDFVFVGAERGDYTRRARPIEGLQALPQGLAPPPADPDAGDDDTLHNIGIFAGITFNF